MQENRGSRRERHFGAGTQLTVEHMIASQANQFEHLGQDIRGLGEHGSPRVISILGGIRYFEEIFRLFGLDTISGEVRWPPGCNIACRTYYDGSCELGAAIASGALAVGICV